MEVFKLVRYRSLVSLIQSKLMSTFKRDFAWTDEVSKLAIMGYARFQFSPIVIKRTIVFKRILLHQDI